MYKKVEEYFAKKGCESVMVNTIDGIGPNGNYQKTRNFYKRMGFAEMLTILKIDDPDTEYLVMMKNNR